MKQRCIIQLASWMHWKKTKITGFMETDTEGIFILYFLFLFSFALRTPVRKLNDLFVPPVPIDLYDLWGRLYVIHSSYLSLYK